MSEDENLKFNSMLDVITAQLEHFQAWHKLVADWISQTNNKIKKLEDFIYGHKLGEKNLVNRIEDLETQISDLSGDLNLTPSFAYIDNEMNPRIEVLEKKVDHLVDIIQPE